MKVVTEQASGITLLNRIGHVTIATIVLLSFSLSGAIAQESDRDDSRSGSGQLGSFNMPGVSVWMKGKFTEAELKTYQPEDFRIEPIMCGCYDRPVPHYPYLLVFFVTPKGDLVGRPDRRGLDTIITRLAVRHGEKYCNVESEDQCYGSFSNPCEFSDFQYGSQLAEYFPSCKTIESEPEQGADSELDRVRYRRSSGR